MGVSLGSVYVRGTVECQLSRAKDGNSWWQWGTFRIYPNATKTCFRHPVYARETQHDPGSLAPMLPGAARRTACCPVPEAERPVPVLPNMVTEMTMLFSDITSRFLSLGMLCILFQDSLAF